ncbi:MAG: RNA-binding protein [Planctomycetota bacterium]|nr:RNA-binding protein [Planctomycetota bacterium]
MKLYVGNLPFSATEDELRAHFQKHGQVVHVMISTERDSGRPRGFGFVEMLTEDEGRRAIEGTNNKPFGGRPLKVNEAQPKEARDGRFGGSGGYWKR